MKVLFYLHHPAHFYLFKNVISHLKEKKRDVHVIATKKDILEDLLRSENISYTNFLPNGRSDNKISIAFGLLKQDIKLFFYCLKHKPNLLIGTSTEICHIGFLLRIPNIFVNEDDVSVSRIIEKLVHPFAKHLLSPDVCNTGMPEKTITYRGYHELAYLHPNVFKQEKKIVEKYFNPDEKYFIIRFAKLGAHHDKGVQGISKEIATKLISILEPHGKIYITSEKPLEPAFEKYRLNIKPIDIHHVMAFANIYIGDSQTMAAEAGVLGTPFIRFNSFVGKIGYLNDLEKKYNLGFGITPDKPEALLKQTQELLSYKNLKDEWKTRKEKMLKEKIDVTHFFSWLIENYPQSINEAKAISKIENQSK